MVRLEGKPKKSRLRSHLEAVRKFAICCADEEAAHSPIPLPVESELSIAVKPGKDWSSPSPASLSDYSNHTIHGAPARASEKYSFDSIEVPGGYSISRRQFEAVQQRNAEERDRVRAAAEAERRKAARNSAEKGPYKCRGVNQVFISTLSKDVHKKYGGDAHTVLCESAPGESKEAPTLEEFLAAQNGKQDDPSAGRCDSDYVVRCSISCNKDRPNRLAPTPPSQPRTAWSSSGSQSRTESMISKSESWGRSTATPECKSPKGNVTIKNKDSYEALLDQIEQEHEDGLLLSNSQAKFNAKNDVKAVENDSYEELMDQIEKEHEEGLLLSNSQAKIEPSGNVKASSPVDENDSYEELMDQIEKEHEEGLLLSNSQAKIEPSGNVKASSPVDENDSYEALMDQIEQEHKDGLLLSNSQARIINEQSSNGAFSPVPPAKNDVKAAESESYEALLDQIEKEHEDGLLLSNSEAKIINEQSSSPTGAFMPTPPAKPKSAWDSSASDTGVGKIKTPVDESRKPKGFCTTASEEDLMDLIQDEDDAGLLPPLKASSKTSEISNKGGKSEPVIVETGHKDPHGGHRHTVSPTDAMQSKSYDDFDSDAFLRKLFRVKNEHIVPRPPAKKPKPPAKESKPLDNDDDLDALDKFMKERKQPKAPPSPPRMLEPMPNPLFPTPPSRPRPKAPVQRHRLHRPLSNFHAKAAWPLNQVDGAQKYVPHPPADRPQRTRAARPKAARGPHVCVVGGVELDLDDNDWAAKLGIENVPDSTPDIAPSPQPGRLYPDIAGKYLNKKGQRFPRRH